MKRPFQIGDRVFVTTVFRGVRRGVIANITEGNGGEVYYWPGDDEETPWGPWFKESQISHMSFVQYCLDRASFGGIPWPLFAVVQYAALLTAVLGAANGYALAGALVGAAINVMLVVAAWMNFKRKTDE